jgi:hypothetical protein
MKRNKLLLIIFICWCTLFFYLNAYAQSEIQGLKHIKEEYLTKCEDPSAKSHGELQNTLNNLDERILDTITNLTTDSTAITKMIKDIDDAFKQIDEKIRGKDLNKKRDQVLDFAETLKGRLGTIKRQITNAKDLTDTSQRDTGGVYCSVNKYMNIYMKRVKNATSPAERKLNKDSAERLDKKRSLILILMKEFDTYWGYLEELHQISEQHYRELDALQHNIVIYINETCKRKRKEECIYEEIGNINLNRAKLYELVNDYKRCLKDVVKNGPSYIEK